MAQAGRNTKLVQLRARRGLTQAQLAELVTDVVRATGPRWRNATLGGEFISRLETGRITWPNSVYRAALRTVLDVNTDADLGLYCQQVAARVRADTVRRRDFLATLPAVALTEHPLRDLVAAATAEPAPPPRRVGPEQVQQILSLHEQARWLGHRYGGGLTREVVAAQVRWAVSLLDAHIDRGVEAELHSALARLLATAGFACFDDGRPDLARYYQAASLRCAEQAADWDRRANTLLDMAMVAAYHGQHDDALTFAQHGLLRADRLSTLRRVQLTLLEAQAYGQRGDAQSCLAAIGRAEDEFTTADPANEPDHLAVVVSAAELASESAKALHHLALRDQHVAVAVERQRTAVTAYSDAFPRSRALAAAKLATLLLHHGDRAEAVQLGHQFLDAAERIQSHRVTDSVRQLHRTTRHHHGSADLDNLRQRASRVLTSHHSLT